MKLTIPEIKPSRRLKKHEVLIPKSQKIDGVMWYVKYRGKISPIPAETRELAMMIAVGVQWCSSMNKVKEN